MTTIIIHGDTPSKKNSRRLFCRGGFPVSLPSANYEKWHEDASNALTVSREIWERCPLQKASLEITIYPRTKRKADLTNKAESVMDFLVDNGILDDDNWFVCGDLVLIFGGVDKNNPRAEVKILNL